MIPSPLEPIGSSSSPNQPKDTALVPQHSDDLIKKKDG